MQKIADMLKSRNIKVTPQRLAIYSVLYNTNIHPSAETIYQELLPTHPTMSLATIYKTLDAFKKAHMVTELNTGGDSFRYDADTSSHPHAICLECGAVQDLHTHLLDDVTDLVQEETDFDIAYGQMYFYGKCSSCK